MAIIETGTQSLDSFTVHMNLAALLAGRSDSGALWASESEDIDCTLMAWADSQGVAAHVNGEVDVAIIVFAGNGEATVGHDTIALSPGLVIVVPKGAQRSIRAVGSRLVYLSVHKRRSGLMPGDPEDRPRPDR